MGNKDPVVPIIIFIMIMNRLRYETILRYDIMVEAKELLKEMKDYIKIQNEKEQSLINKDESTKTEHKTG